MKHTPPPKWLHNLLLDGMDQLLLLRLDFSPAPEEIPSLLEGWKNTFWQNRNWTEADTPRIQKAFMKTASECTKWPAPAMVIKNVERLNNTLDGAIEFEINTEKRQRNLALLKQMRDALASGDTNTLKELTESITPSTKETT